MGTLKAVPTFTLISSNSNTLEYFKNSGLKNLKFELNPELDADDKTTETFLDKSIASGENKILLFEFFEVNGEKLPYKPTEDLNDENVIWTIFAIVNDGKYIKIFEGICKGVIKNSNFKNKKPSLCFLDDPKKIIIRNFLRNKYIFKHKLQTQP